MNQIQISNVAVRQISDTLYNLNDLHKAAGGENKHRPTFWMQNIQTQELIAEVEAQGGQAFQTAKGKNGGTYVCKELVIAYGMWINAAFALKVIRCFLEAQGQVSDGIKTVTAKTTADDRTGLRQAVAALVGRKGIDYSSAYSMVHQRFNVEAIEDIPTGQLPEAVAYVHALTLHTGLVGEVLDREPLPAPQPALPISGNALYDLAVALRYGAWAIQMGKDVSAPLKQLGCRQAVTMWTIWGETRSRLKAAANALEDLSAHADAEHAAKIRPMLPEIRNLSAV
ncbi:KilA-N domain-containing protein [Neisseria polysaccharea]|uniref:KilA-N domain-containing protein n=1 Tax=Neisseria polysaccharea TaxID=489 RepID=UPI00272BB65D|nr:KilA-N domain-containing protein [Neisseria polysaccharea]